MKYILLAVAIICEVAGTSAMSASQQFTKLLPSVLTIVAYICSFYFLSLSLKSISIGTAYAMWSGLGMVLTSIAAMVLFKQNPDLPAIIGMVLIITGVVVMSVFSKTASH